VRMVWRIDHSGRGVFHNTSVTQLPIACPPEL